MEHIWTCCSSLVGSLFSHLVEVFELSWKPLLKVNTAETHSSKATHTIGLKLPI